MPPKKLWRKGALLRGTHKDAKIRKGHKNLERLCTWASQKMPYKRKSPAGAGLFYGVGEGLGHATAEGHAGHAEGQERQGRRLGDGLRGIRALTRHQGRDVFLRERLVIAGDRFEGVEVSGKSLKLSLPNFTSPIIG